ncbi:hypothetical protein BDR07DRAFT_1080716 [Suillus spraguei]|nr:hypothetical protein BDR07DRAFT_1080716 [Suillus spraguei]
MRGCTTPSIERKAYLPCPTPSQQPCCKAFPLHEAPKTTIDWKNRTTSGSKCRRSRPAKPTKQHDVGDIERRMQNIVPAQGRLSNKGGKMISSGIDELYQALPWIHCPY